MMIGSITVNCELAVFGLEIEFTVTVTGPVPTGTELGTVATICVLLQLVIDVATAPLNVTVLVPCVAPKFDPLIVTGVPIVPTIGYRLETEGVEPAVIETLSKEAVAVDPLELVASPTYTVCAMVTVVFPSDVHD